MPDALVDRRGNFITRYAEQLCALGAAAIGLISGLAWLLGSSQTLAFGVSHVPMAPISALLFILLGTAIFVHSRWPLKLGSHVLNITSVFIISLCLLLGSESLGGMDPAIERLFVEQSYTAAGLIVGRLAPLTALSFVLANTAFLCQGALLSRRPQPLYIALTCAWLLFLIAEVTVTSYASGFPPYVSATKIPMALLSACAFILISVSLLLRSLVQARRQLLPHGFRLGKNIVRYVLFSLACLAVAAVLRLTIVGSLGRIDSFITLYPAVTVAALYGGLTGGLLATVFAGMYSQVWIKGGMLSGVEWTSMAAFLSSGTLISVICEAMLLNRDRIMRTNNQLEAEISRRRMDEITLHEQFDVIIRAKNNLEELNKKLVQAQDQLLQSEKMAAIGQLAAGIAHEINNPIGYVSSNLGTLEKYMADIFEMMDKYDAAEAEMKGKYEVLDEIVEFKKSIDLEYLRQDIQVLLAESREGLGRVKKIVLDMKSFSHSHADDEWVWADIHAGLESTLNVVWNELKYKCEVKKEFGALPPVYCLPSQLNQVFMNLLVNAAQAIEIRGTITLRTGLEKSWVWVEIADTGKGIPAEDLPHIFDPFFTTKPVGKGTGLGLSISYNVIQKHHGQIEVQSEVGKGTVFRVRLPVQYHAPQGSAAELTAPVAG